MKGNASCHTSTDAYRERYEAMVWDSDKNDDVSDTEELDDEITPPSCMDDI